MYWELLAELKETSPVVVDGIFHEAPVAIMLCESTDMAAVDKLADAINGFIEK